MFTCLWKMWDWLDPTAMESKKFMSSQNTGVDPPVGDTGPPLKHLPDAEPLRVVQYGGYTPVHQHPALLPVWGAMQPPPVHYHQQRPTKQWSVPAPKPPDQTEPKKKILHTSSNQQLRSPCSKRPTDATVTRQGWLHKQGSDGLKVWRKRWFVLSDYCLYYYKGPEEEKVLGSILLPSYKVSLCGPDDKVYRKFSFKCEHANMRTYYLAADSQELMMDWIRALNLACMLQSNVDSDRQSGPSVSSVYNASLDNSDSGFHQQYHTHPHTHPHTHIHTHTHTHPNQHPHSVPLHIHSGSNTSENPSNPSYSPEVANCVQPLYANAPPKPRRLTDGGYSSPSPEFPLDRYNADMKHPHAQFVPPPHYSVQYAVNRNCSKSPVNVYMRNCDNRLMAGPGVSYTQTSQIPYGKVNHTICEHQMHATPKRDSANNQNVERRTPDTYGRSKLSSNKVKDASDYEDVYSDEIMYKRPLSPVAYSNIKKVSPVASMTVQHRPYTPLYISGPPRQETIPAPGYKVCVPAPQHTDRVQPNTIPRPHSADFLEYEVKHRNFGKSNTVNSQQPRPKSSLDISRPAGDYYYSRESYAESMRKSALYLQQLPTHYHVKGNDHLVMINGQKIYQRPNYMHDTPPSVYPPRNLQQMPCSASAQFHEKTSQPTRSGSVLSEGSLDVDLASSPYAKSPVCHLQDDRDYDYSNKEFGDGQGVSPVNRDYHNEQFKRSASARLVRTPTQAEKPLHEEQRPVSREGERKREESMKRLLEWKQRMLQSPLNRKLSSNLSVARGIGGRSLSQTSQGPPPGPGQGPGTGHAPNYEYLPTVDGRRSLTALPQYSSYSSDDEASGSISLTAHETFPRAISAKRIWTPNSQPSSRSATLTHPRTRDNDYSMSTSHLPQGCINAGAASCDMNQHINSRKAGWQWSDRMNVSAGELLGRTHEELVLLLIQLRRQSTNTCHAIESCYTEIENIQSQLNNMDAAKRLENLQKLEQLKQHLLELEKQYEKGKPLVNLVDNMVKLGSLYRSPNDHTYAPHVRDRLEFNQQIQERRLLAEERRDWNRLSPNHLQLKAKVQQLYQLDRLLQEESRTLQGLQLDKEKIERALGGLRQRLNRGHNDPSELEQARKQQTVLENELSRVHYMLAQNSKKLEETVAGNARLEQELLVLRQKLQLSRQQRSSPQFSNAGDSLPCAAGTSAMLESELHRVQQLVGDLQRQRQELSLQVRQLTDRSHSLSQQIRPTCSTPVHFTQGSSNNKKRTQTFWRETDLDTMHSVDHGLELESQNKSRSTTPLYVNTDTTKQVETDLCYTRPIPYDFQSDDSQQHSTEFAGCIPQEKQEIKTVRIVKRESERRQRDREKTSSTTNTSGSSGSQPKWDPVVEEDDLNFYGVPSTHIESSISSLSSDNQSLHHLTPMDKSKTALSRHASVSSPSLRSPMENNPSDVRNTLSGDIALDKSPALSPVFKSEAARQIIIEMSGGVASEPSTLKSSARRMIPKEKRRHYTAPHNNLIMKSLNQLPTEDSFIRLEANTRRARDDLDMERALRQRTDTPDVVRSTLSSKELKYNENTIDNILGTPNKISIPERYIPEQLPQLSPEEQQHRLRKVESIKKMLSDTTILSSTSSVPTSNAETEKSTSSLVNKATSKMVEEKRQREHLLQLNQILAKQVMEMSKIVAGSTPSKAEH